MTDLAIIGGSGLDVLSDLEPLERHEFDTPYGHPSAPVVIGRYADTRIAFLPRHGPEHVLPPHRINYRANIRALNDLGVRRIIGIAAVGGITALMTPGRVVIPHQIIDYTWGRAHTFFDGESGVTHVDFTEPYSSELRIALLEGALAAGLEVVDYGTYAATQGPRLESAAEIKRLANDGCDLVGMTGMPEAALARELGIRYACCAVVANRAAGLGGGIIEMSAIETTLAASMNDVARLLRHTLADLRNRSQD